MFPNRHLQPQLRRQFRLAPFYMQIEWPAKCPATKGHRMLRIKAKRGQPVKDHRQCHMRHKGPRRKGASAEMRPSAKGDMFFGVAPDVKDVGPVEMRRVPVCRAEHEKGPASLWKPDPVDCLIARDPSG